jgi:hypothetical protein
MSARRRFARHGAAWLLGLGLASCARTPAPSPEPAPVVPAANPAAPVVAPRRVSGLYDLITTLHVTRRPATRSSRRSRRTTRPPPATLRLSYQALAAPDATASSLTQLAAIVSIPGYTRSPAGRTGQTAAWWPLPGDSVVVHFQTPRGDGTMELRGTFQRDTLAGDVWFTSVASGTTYQMGTFVGVKRRRRR